RGNRVLRQSLGPRIRGDERSLASQFNINRSHQHVDTPGHRPTLTGYRGVPHQRLRNRDSGDPLNLIRVMPAKGQEHSMSTSIFLAKLIGPVCLAIVLTHNVWAGDWRILITILGWLAVIGGLFRLLAPQRAVAVGRTLLTNPSTLHISTGIYLLIGALLCFFGYRH